MPTYTFHEWDPGERQESVFDYEGWAHARPACWLIPKQVEAADIDSARKIILRDYGPYIHHDSYFVRNDFPSEKLPIWTPDMKILWKSGKLLCQKWMQR